MRCESAERLRIDLIAECIWRDGVRYGVPPKAFLVLRYLMERPEQLVTKAELLDAIWPNTYVIDTVLNVAIGELRHALGDDPKQARFVATVHRRGFRWVGPPARALSAAVAADPGTFVGRTATLAQIDDWRARANGGQRQLVLVSGEPGIGKTTVVDRFLHGLQNDAARGVLVAYGQCIDRYGVGEVYRPLLDAAEALVRSGGDPVRRIFRKHAPTWLLQMSDVVDAQEMAELRRRVADATLAWMQREIERALEVASTDRFVVLALEDLHWADSATIGLLGSLAAGRAPARLLILGTYRPYDAIAHQHPIIQLKHELVARQQCSEIVLDGLTSEAVGTYFDRRFGQHHLPATLTARLHAQTSGNPLFLLNALADCEQRGWLCQQDGVWEWSGDVDRIAATMPDGTRDVISYRLDQLSPTIQEILEAASLAGMSFTTQVVAAATQRADDEIETACRRLTHGLFLEEGGVVEWPDGSRGRQLAFRHSLYRQILEDRVPASRRPILHRRIADRMERGYGGRAGEIAAALSYHYEHAGDAYRAIDYIEILVQQTYPRRAMHEAIPLIESAVKLLEKVPESDGRQARLLHLNAALGFFTGTTVGGNQPLSKQATENLSTAISSSNAAENLGAVSALIMGHMVGGRFREACRTGEEVLSACGNQGTEAALLSGHAGIGIALFYLGELDRALPHLERAAAITASLPEAGEDMPTLSFGDPSVPSLSTLAQTLTLAGRARRGAEAIETALSYGRRFAMPWFVGYPLSVACTLGMYRREPGEIRRRAQQLQAHCDVGSPYLQGTARFMLAWSTLIESGDTRLLAELCDTCEELAATSNPLTTHRLMSNVAEAFFASGDFAQAETWLDRAFEMRGEASYYDAELHRQRAAIRLASAGEKRTADVRNEAEALLETAHEIARRQGAHLLRLRATVSLCRLRFRERRGELRDRLSTILSSFDDALEDADVRQARELLRQTPT